MDSPEETVLSLDNFSAGFLKDGKIISAVDSVSFDVKHGRTLGIVGESGCGKSVTALSIMRLLPVPSGKYTGGEILFRGTDLLSLSPEEMRNIRGNSISMIFQEPMTALNPVYKIGRQISEVFELHRKDLSKQEIEDKTLTLLNRTGISDPRRIMDQYPHQLSGGMRQRVMIAIALVCGPEILIADEPTTALDVTIQAQILDLIKELQAASGMSVIFITHDLGVIAGLCDDVVVMYAGRVAEKASVRELFSNPLHPYTKGLLDSIPRFEYPRKTKLNSIEGMVPSLADYPAGCRFHNRCPQAFYPCQGKHPAETVINSSHKVNCYRYGGQ
jgi:oligopeptide/dipeptide ABC transporter ATP-binding protein